MITRYNYEEFFLLYVDNELSAAERKAVEEFVQQNTDLEEELTMLQQSVIKPESNILFEDKNLLLRQTEEDSLINLNNYEEYFLLYIDNELDQAAKKDVEIFVNQNPSLQNELSLLQQAKLETDNAIVFEGKEILYKKEEKRKPIPFAWMSAAAVVILLVTGFLFYNKFNQPADPEQRKNISSSLKNNNEKDSLIDKNKKEDLAVTQLPVDSLNNKEEIKTRMAAQENKQEKQTQAARYAINNQKENKKDNKNNPDVALTNNDSRKQQKPQIKNAKLDNIEKINPEEKEISTSLAASELNAKPKNLIEKNNPADETVKTDTEKTYAAQVAIADNIDYIDTDNTSAKKNKLRGIFRKVSRVFEKTTNVEDGNKHAVSIGSFQIALK